MIVHQRIQIGGNMLDSRVTRNNPLAGAIKPITYRCDWRSKIFIAYGSQHFRTPSPCGRHVIPSHMSLTIYFGPTPVIWRGFASVSHNCDLRLNRGATMSPVQARRTTEHRGRTTCTLKHGNWRWRPSWRSPHAVTHSQNKALSAQAPARQRLLSLMDRPSLAQWSAPRAICSTARPIQASVTNTYCLRHLTSGTTTIFSGQRRSNGLVRASRRPFLHSTHHGLAPRHPKRTA